MSSRPALGSTQPPIQWVPGSLSSGVKRQEREADHSSPASVEVKKMLIYTSTPPFLEHGFGGGGHVSQFMGLACSDLS
jgi:hypothetical protein